MKTESQTQYNNTPKVGYNQVELERTDGDCPAVSGYMAGGDGAMVSSPSPIPASIQTTKSQGWGGGSPSLDIDVSSSNAGTVHEWDRKQKRGYHRIQSCLTYWQANGYQVLWVMLSTAVGGDASKLAYHHQRLRQRIEARLGYGGLQHFQVRTSEGNGVLHIFWAWRADNGFRQRSFYVKQDWLSEQWQGIHGAEIVWICRVRGSRVSRNKLSRYCMAQYVGGQAGYEYMSWSWGRTFGFPLVACWKWLKQKARYNRSLLLHWWSIFLSGGFVPGIKVWMLPSPVVIDMGLIRVKYREYGSMLWET